MVNEIITILNNALVGLQNDQKVHGLAQSVVRKAGTELELLPGIVDKTGEIQYVGIDDVQSLIIYHKLNSLSSTPKNNGRGDNPGDLMNTYGMTLIAYWDRKRYNKMPDELLFIIQSRFPQLVVNVPDIKTLKVKIVNTNFNSLQVFNQEYQGAQFNLLPNANLIQINYTIETTFNPACLPTC